MSDRTKPSEAHKILSWLTQNRRMLLERYRDRYVAYNAEQLIAHSEKLQEVLEIAEATGEPFLIYLVPRTNASIQILPIQFRAVTRHDWQPNYPVELQHGKIKIATSMLVDSGAEVSLISLKTGQDLGYALADAEVSLVADTIGGTVEYVLRNVEMTIDNHKLSAPVAWLQTPTRGEQLLLGREVIFEKFDIEFKQAEEKIIFTWRQSEYSVNSQG